MEGIMDLFATADDVIEEIKTALKRKRLELNLSQSTLAERSGVSLSTIKRFERTGKASLKILLELAHVLGYLTEIRIVFINPMFSLKQREVLSLLSEHPHVPAIHPKRIRGRG